MARVDVFAGFEFGKAREAADERVLGVDLQAVIAGVTSLVSQRCGDGQR